MAAAPGHKNRELLCSIPKKINANGIFDVCKILQNFFDLAAIFLQSNNENIFNKFKLFGTTYRHLQGQNTNIYSAKTFVERKHKIT